LIIYIIIAKKITAFFEKTISTKNQSMNKIIFMAVFAILTMPGFAQVGIVLFQQSFFY